MNGPRLLERLRRVGVRVRARVRGRVRVRVGVGVGLEVGVGVGVSPRLLERLCTLTRGPREPLILAARRLVCRAHLVKVRVRVRVRVS